MVGRPPSQSDTGRGWHKLVEHYTPDGTVGRVLLSLGTGTAALTGFAFAAIGFANFGVLWFFTAIFSLGVGLCGSLLTVLLLWPVYLSLIGNIESPETYLQSDVSSSVAHVDDPEDATEVLKRQYAAGNISSEEFERRLDTLLDTEEDARSRRQGRQNSSGDFIRETN